MSGIILGIGAAKIPGDPSQIAAICVLVQNSNSSMVRCGRRRRRNCRRRMKPGPDPPISLCRFLPLMSGNLAYAVSSTSSRFVNPIPNQMAFAGFDPLHYFKVAP